MFASRCIYTVVGESESVIAADQLGIGHVLIPVEPDFDLNTQTHAVLIRHAAQKIQDFRALAYSGYECADVIATDIVRIRTAIG
jgi:hypothetical protein